MNKVKTWCYICIFQLKVLLLLLYYYNNYNIWLKRENYIHVSNKSNLENALRKVNPGDSIIMADGLYVGPIRLTRSGSVFNPITLAGSIKAFITSQEFGIHLKANYWILRGFTVTNCQKGVILDSANFNLIDNLSICHINDEAVHFLNTSSDNTIQNCIIKNTGLMNPGFGEGVYVGSALKNWINNKPDLSNRNRILNNRFGPNISAESIDIKEGSENNLIEGNVFDGNGMSGANYADSWIDVKGANNIIRNNCGNYSLLDGFQTQSVFGSVSNSGCNNEFINNLCYGLDPQGVCVHIKNKC